MAEIVQHPSSPEPPPPAVKEPNGADPGAEPAEVIDDINNEEPEPGELELETRELLIMLKHEVGLNWMSLRLRLQMETVELLLIDAGAQPAT